MHELGKTESQVFGSVVDWSLSEQTALIKLICLHPSAAAELSSENQRQLPG